MTSNILKLMGRKIGDGRIRQIENENRINGKYTNKIQFYLCRLWKRKVK